MVPQVVFVLTLATLYLQGCPQRMNFEDGCTEFDKSLFLHTKVACRTKLAENNIKIHLVIFKEFMVVFTVSSFVVNYVH